MPRPLPLDRLRSTKKSTYKRVSICLDSQYQTAYEEARSALGRFDMQARIKPSDEDKRHRAMLESEVDDAKRAMDENSALFHVRSLGPKNYDKLKTQYPPTEEQRKDAKKDGHVLTWDVEEFPFALIQHCASYVWTDEDGTEHLEPLTEEFVEDMKNGEQWSAGDLQRLSNAAFEVNLGIPNVGALGNA